MEIFPHFLWPFHEKTKLIKYLIKIILNFRHFFACEIEFFRKLTAFIAFSQLFYYRLSKKGAICQLSLVQKLNFLKYY